MATALDSRVSPLRDESIMTPMLPASNWREGLILGTLIFLLSLVLGYIAVFHYGIIIDDAMSRVMNAYYAIFRRQFHLAAIGFVWNPLPSLIELPIVAFHKVWPGLLTRAYAGNIVSAVFGGIGIYYFNRVMWLLGSKQLTRIVWSLLYALNPLILWYSANGMTDGMLVATFVATLSNVIGFLKSDRTVYLLWAGIWLALGFLIRYEAVPFAFFVGLGLMIGLLRRGYSWSRVESTIILLGLPITAAALAWMFVSWMIMGNPIYFITSPYGNAAQIATGAYNDPQVIAASHHIGSAFLVVCSKTLLFWPAIPLVFIAAILALKRKQSAYPLVLIGATVAVPLLQLYLLYSHKSANWERFYIYFIPNAYVTAFYVYNRLFSRWNKILKGFSQLVLLLLLASGNLGTWWAMNSQAIGGGYEGERTDMRKIETNNTSVMPSITVGAEIARYINAHPHLVVLIDSFSSFSVIANIKNPKQVVITSDQDFQSVLLNPRGRINAILVPKPVQLSKFDEMNQVYPTMWTGGVHWTKLIYKFPHSTYKLYAVLGNAP